MLNPKIKPKEEVNKCYEAIINNLKPNDKFYLVFMDGDGLKAVNDTHGHIMGDEVLKTMTDVLVEHAAGDDQVFRFGGDEFLLLMVRPSFEIAEAAIKNLQKDIRNKPKLKDLKVDRMGLSAGMVYYDPDKDPTIEQMLHAADTAMYKAKDKGRRMMHSQLVYTEDLDAVVELLNFTRSTCARGAVLRMYFDFILGVVMKDNPEFDIDKLRSIQRAYWTKWEYEVLNMFSPMETANEFVELYNDHFKIEEAA